MKKSIGLFRRAQEEAGRNINAVNGDGWTRIAVAVDSGACDNVIGPETLTGYADFITETAASLSNQDFVSAALVTGLSHGQIISRHIIPNIIGPVIVYITLTIPSVMLLEAFLSFLGLGIQPPQSSWGVLISGGVETMEEYPWLLLFPGLTLSATLFALNFLGDGLRDALDPRTTRD